MLAAGQDAALTGPATVSWSGHDLAGRPHAETVAGSSLTTTWDTWDHPVGLALPSGSAYTRTFDTLDQLASVTGTAGLPGASWTWGGGRLYGVETAGGVTTHLIYSGQPGVTAPPGASDSPWRLAGLSWGAGGATWGTLGYAYRGTADLPGDGAKLGRSATGDLAASLDWSWQLDAASRLIGASSGVGSDFRQGYGEADQLVTLARDDTGDSAELGSGPSGRLTERDGVTFGYDASGRRTSDDRASYRWDWRGRLAEVTISPDAGSPFAGHQIQYLYDGVGRLRARVHLGPDDGSGSRPFIEYRSFLWEGNALLEEEGWGSNDGTWDDPASDLFPRWRRTYVPGPGLDDAPAVRVEIFEPEDTPYPDATYAFLRDELGTVVGVVQDGSSTDPGLLVRYLYTPYGEAHAEAGPELRRLLFDNDRTTVDTYEQTVADPATHAAGALLLGLSLPADPATIAAGIALTDDTAGTVLAQGADYVAVGILEQPETVALLPLEGWVRGHSYRVTLTGSLTDTAGRTLTQARELALVIPAEGAVTAAAPPDLAVTYDSVAAASSDLGGRFPGGQTMLFQGLWTDPTTGLAYARNRWYDPHNAAWLSEDPLGPVDSSNLYAFVGWGPASATDPMGLRGPAVDPDTRIYRLLRSEVEENERHKEEAVQAYRDLRFLLRWDVLKYNLIDPTHSQAVALAALRLLWHGINVPLSAPGMSLMLEPEAIVAGPTKVVRVKKAAEALEELDDLARGASTVDRTVSEVEYVVDEAGRTVSAEGRIAGPHPGRSKGYRPEPTGGRTPGEHRGHLIPEGGVDDPTLVNVRENIISEARRSNLSAKKQLDTLVSRIAAQNPDAVVRLRAEPLRRAGEARPFAVTYTVTKDGEVVHAVTIINE